MVVASGQQRLARRRAQRGGVEAVVLQAARRQLLRVRRLAGAAEGARRAEAGVVDQDDQDVRRALGRAQLLDRRVLRLRILRVIGDQAAPRRVRHREVGAMLLVVAVHNFGTLGADADGVSWARNGHQAKRTGVHYAQRAARCATFCCAASTIQDA